MPFVEPKFHKYFHMNLVILMIRVHLLKKQEAGKH